MELARRSSQQHGMVHFPVDRYPSTREGGMFVRLWVVSNESYGLCAGVGVVELISEVFLGTDVLIPQMEADAQTIAAAWATPMGSVEELDSVLALEKDLDAKTRGRLVSTTSLGDVAEVVCSITLGSTGWSNGEWRCTYDDLSADGKALYDTMRRLYPTCTLHLATFLDT